MSITGRVGLLALAGVAVVVLVPSWLGVAAVATVLLIAVAMDLTLAGDARALQFERTGDRSVRLGAPVDAVLAVRNPGRRPVRGVLRDAWPPSAGAQRDRHPLDVPAGGRAAVVTELRPIRRGERRADRVTVRAVGPLGLAARQVSHEVPWTVRVVPPFESRKHLPARLDRLRQLDGRQAARVRGEGTEFDSLREYVIGDDVRSIDWRATARASDTMVRTWRPERGRRLVLALDTGRTSAARVGDGTRLDVALDAALLLTVLAGRAGDHVDVIAYDRVLRTRLANVAAANLQAVLLDSLAHLEPTLVETDAHGLVSEVLRHTGGASLVVLLTGLDAAPLEQGLLPVLPALTARHRVLVAGVSDPRIAEMARARGDADADAVYDAVAAERTLAERRRVLALLTGRGVDVVDAGPDALAPALADRYLAIKSRGWF